MLAHVFMDLANSWFALINFLLASHILKVSLITLEKWFPLQGERGHSSYFWSFKNIIERRGVGDRIKTTGLSIYPRL